MAYDQHFFYRALIERTKIGTFYTKPAAEKKKYFFLRILAVGRKKLSRLRREIFVESRFQELLSQKQEEKIAIDKTYLYCQLIKLDSTLLPAAFMT